MKRLAALSLVAAGALAIACLPLPGMPDVPVFLQWIATLGKRGIVEAYRHEVAPYPPLGFVLLAGVGPLASALGIGTQLALKLLLLSALALSVAIAWAWTRDARVCGLLAWGLLLSGPALGYLDVLCLPTLLLALWALQRERLALASLLFALSCLIKWQPVVLAPPLLIFALAPATPADRGRRLLSLALPALAAVGLTVAFFGRSVLDRLALGAADPFLCGQAFNANWIASYGLHVLAPERFGGLEDGLCGFIETRAPALLVPPRLVFALVYLALCRFAWATLRSFPDLLRHALLAYLAWFLFSPGVHENHLFFGQVLAVLLYAVDRRRLPTALLWSAAANLNLLLYYGWDGGFVPELRRVSSLDLGLPLAILNVAAFLALVVITRRDALTARAQPHTPALR